MAKTIYRGRFAPSPSGLLHAGSIATALGSWLDARASRGTWLIRIEDLDTPRNQAGADLEILRQLSLFGLESDEPVIWQSKSLERYQNSLERLIEHDLTYPCKCSRKEVEVALEKQGVRRQRHQEMIYPGTCRDQAIDPSLYKCAWRAKLPPNTVISGQHLNIEVGDFILKRADGIFSYQLAVVVDDDFQKITDIVRGSDLLDNTPRQIWLQQALQLSTPRYKHLPLVLNEEQEKLSKQTKATPLIPKNEQETIELLGDAAQHLGLDLPKENAIPISEWLARAVNAWALKNPISPLG